MYIMHNCTFLLSQKLTIYTDLIIQFNNKFPHCRSKMQTWYPSSCPYVHQILTDYKNSLTVTLFSLKKSINAYCRGLAVIWWQKTRPRLHAEVERVGIKQSTKKCSVTDLEMRTLAAYCEWRQRLLESEATENHRSEVSPSSGLPASQPSCGNSRTTSNPCQSIHSANSVISTLHKTWTVGNTFLISHRFFCWQHVSYCLFLKGNCSEKFLLQNIFGFHVYITNIYVKLSTETVIMQKTTLMIILFCAINSTRPYLIFNQTTFTRRYAPCVISSKLSWEKIVIFQP